MGEWFEELDDSLWLRGPMGAAEEAWFIHRALGLGRGASVLDVPCGAGRISVHLARAGCDVTGVDLRARFLARARAAFRRAGVRGRFRRGDMRDLAYDGAFDAALNWFGSFGYFSDAENRDVLCRMARAVRPGGRVLVEQINREWVLRHFRRRMVAGHVTRLARWDGATARVESTWIVRRGSRRDRFPLSMRLYTPGQLRRLFEAAGLEVVALYGDWAGAPYRRGARRLVMVGRRGRAASQAEGDRTARNGRRRA
jgi:SAM-dependent methyltransferase